MRVAWEWYGDEKGKGSEEHVVWDELEETPLPGDGVNFGIATMIGLHVIRKTWVHDDNGWYVHIILRHG